MRLECPGFSDPMHVSCSFCPWIAVKFRVQVYLTITIYSPDSFWVPFFARCKLRSSQWCFRVRWCSLVSWRFPCCTETTSLFPESPLIFIFLCTSAVVIFMTKKLCRSSPGGWAVDRRLEEAPERLILSLLTNRTALEFLPSWPKTIYCSLTLFLV